MIPVASIDVFEAGLAELRTFGSQTGARGRFIALYLGLRLMGDTIAPLGSGNYTQLSSIEAFLDHMWTKVHKRGPLNVLTAPFGGGGANGGYSTATRAVAPGNAYPTNTWRNNLNSQKGVGCVAPAGEVEALIARDDPRAACPHYAFNGAHFYCALSGARYRGEQHSIWLRRTEAGFQVVDLDQPSVFERYLRPGGARIPLYPLLATLYGFAPFDVYPQRREVTGEEFASDFGFDERFIAATFDGDIHSPANARVLETAARTGGQMPSQTGRRQRLDEGGELDPLPGISLPPLPEQISLNSGVQGEILVAHVLEAAGWTVFYTGNQPLLGYDLRAESVGAVLHVEVKSSTGYVTPVLTESEWKAAGRLRETYLLAVVDFVGSASPVIRFVLDPSGSLVPTVNRTTNYRLAPNTWKDLAQEIPPMAGN